MKKELIIFLILVMLLFVSITYSQNETESEDGNETITEDNETTTEGDETEVLKSPLVDCLTVCRDANGCVCPQDCEKNETTQGLNCGKKTTAKTTAPVKEVSLCEGCLTSDKTCLEIGTQKQESEEGNLVYCSSDKKLEQVKGTGEACDYDYECLTYYCENQLCAEKVEEKKDYTLVIIIGAVILFISMAFLAFKIFFSHKQVVKEEPKKDEGIGRREFKIPEYKYEYKPGFDALEKQLKESLGKIKK